MERESSKECSAFFLWRKGSFSSRNHPSRNSTLFSSRRSAWSVLKCNQDREVFAEFSGTFWTLWPRQLRFWKAVYVFLKVQILDTFRSSANEFYSKILFTVYSRLNIRILKAYLQYKFTPAVQRVNEASFFEVKTSWSCEDVNGFYSVMFGPGGKAIISCSVFR